MTKVLLFVVPVILGLALLLLSRWARTRNRTLAAGSSDSRHGAFLDAFRARQYRAAAQLFFFGNLSPVEARLGRLLALGVVVVLGAALILLCVLLATA